MSFLYWSTKFFCPFLLVALTSFCFINLVCFLLMCTTYMYTCLYILFHYCNCSYQWFHIPFILLDHFHIRHFYFQNLICFLLMYTPTCTHVLFHNGDIMYILERIVSITIDVHWNPLTPDTIGTNQFVLDSG